MCASSEGSDEIVQACMGLIALICDKSNNRVNWPICRKQSSSTIINDPIREGLFSRNLADACTQRRLWRDCVFIALVCDKSNNLMNWLV